MTFLEYQIEKIKNNSVVIVYPEGTDPSIIQAASRIIGYDIATPVLVGHEEKIRQTAEELHVDISGARIIDPPNSEKLDAYAEEFSVISKYPLTTAKVLLKKPLYYSAMMVRTGDADCMAAGILTETAEVVAAYKLILGMEEGIETPSCISFVETLTYQNGEEENNNLIAMADTAINAAPSSKELADIAIASAHTVRHLLGWEPRVAMLSFSTLGSSNHESARKVAQAVQIANEREPELLIDGEMQLDTAVSPDVAERKFTRESQVAGRANILVFPDLGASNIGIKLLQRLAGMKSNGGILQGFARPVIDLSRGATVDQVERNSVCLITTAYGQKTEKGE